jgi:hypothetical protein
MDQVLNPKETIALHLDIGGPEAVRRMLRIAHESASPIGIIAGLVPSLDPQQFFPDGGCEPRESHVTSFKRILRLTIEMLHYPKSVHSDSHSLPSNRKVSTNKYVPETLRLIQDVTSGHP